MADARDVARMAAIIDRCRRSYGVEVLEVPGWQVRGATWARVPVGIVDHHDASTRKSGEWGALGVVVKGRPDVPPPLSQFQVARCLDGRPRLAVVAAGRANHAGKGGPMWAIPRDGANGWVLGAECANDGTAEPYTPAAHHAHDALFRAAADVCGFPLSHVVGHREWAPGRKTDPRYDMAWRRACVAAVTPRGDPAPTPPPAPDWAGPAVLREGDTGEWVAAVQLRLAAWYPTARILADGRFGPKTTAAVVRAQVNTPPLPKLTGDGKVGPQTRDKLGL